MLQVTGYCDRWDSADYLIPTSKLPAPAFPVWIGRLWHLSRMRDTPEFDETWDDHNTCTGHNSGDTQPFRTDLFLDAPRPPTPAQRSVALRRFQEGFSQGIDGIKSYYTNDDLYRMAKPDGEQLPYMYDNFNWEHCDVSPSLEQGNVFNFFVLVNGRSSSMFSTVCGQCTVELSLTCLARNAFVTCLPEI